MRKYTFLFAFFFGAIDSTAAQTIISGVVIDVDNQVVLPFVNIGIKHKNVGTSSLHDGSFTIRIPAQNENDSLTFSMVGYEELTVAIKNVTANHQKLFPLKRKVQELTSVTVSGVKLVEKKIGIVKYHPVVHFTDGSTNQNDIFEIAQLIRLDTILSKITSVNLYIDKSRIDSGTFRINFYGFDANKPTNRVIEQQIIQTLPIQEGWLKFDLALYNIYLKGNFVIAIEFIPTGRNSDPIYYEVKLGGATKSFVRTSSQGEWTIPPHHYRIFITALVPDSKYNSLASDLEENETPPSTALFSQFVKDSFHLFIHLPKNYAKQKKQSFSVIYLLDANAYFDIVANAMDENKNNKAILVGIGYKDFLTMDSLRLRDYTFPKACCGDSLPISGGADKFLSFLESELVPYIDSSYRTDKQHRTLMGHSFGGYFTLYALEAAINKKDSTFTGYVAASPSLGYGDQYIVKQFRNITYSDSIQRTLFITFGKREDTEDGGTGTSGLDRFNAFTNLLSDSRFQNIKFNKEIYQTFGHMETAIPTFFKAVNEMK